MDPGTEKPKKKHVHLEKEKARYTSHWDMDYMPLQKVRALYRRQTQRAATQKPVESQPPPPSNRRLGVILVLAGLAMLLVAALLGRWGLA